MFLSVFSDFEKFTLQFSICVIVFFIPTLQLINDDDGNVNIPDFFYAEDGLQLFKAIRDYVEKYVNHYYGGFDSDGKLL